MISITSHFTRSHRTALVATVCLIAIFAGVVLVAARNDDEDHLANAITATAADASAKEKTAERFGRLPLSFERNAGQTDEAVKFLSCGSGYSLFLTPSEAVLRFRKSGATDLDANVHEGSVVRLKMAGAAAAPQVKGVDELPGKVNYFVGNDQDKWRPNVPTYRKVQYKDVYPGIDVVYYGNQRELEYDFLVAPRANPKLIRFSIEGAERIRLDDAGNLLLTLSVRSESCRRFSFGLD